MEIEIIRGICLKLKGCNEEVKWDNDLVFSVRGKMFCIASLEPPLKCSFKVKEEEFEELSNSMGFMPAPYLARAKWVQVINPSQLHKDEWEHFIMQSYELVKAKLPKKMRAELDEE